MPSATVEIGTLRVIFLVNRSNLQILFLFPLITCPVAQLRFKVLTKNCSRPHSEFLLCLEKIGIDVSWFTRNVKAYFLGKI